MTDILEPFANLLGFAAFVFWQWQAMGLRMMRMFLVGVAGRLYTIASDYQIGTSHAGFAAVGSGYLAALGALHATPDRTPEDRLRLALEAAADLTSAVRLPFTTVTAGEGA